MKKRTWKASKAVNLARKREQELVGLGLGTRDWTPSEQKDIMEKGKAYFHSDDPSNSQNGRQYEGHHMMSVEAYPEFQGDPGNIQFLSHDEHLAAHSGNYKNATHGYFNPMDQKMHEFKNNTYTPCPIIRLTNPIALSQNTEDPKSGEKDKL